jgi:pimeloyl-ACP methyl ester carboxylesterase
VIERAHALGKDLSRECLLRGVRAFFDRPDLSDFARVWAGRIDAISGEHDRTPSPETSETVARSAVDGRFHLVRDCGHYVNLERQRPSTRFSTALCERPARRESALCAVRGCTAIGSGATRTAASQNTRRLDVE